MLQPIMHQLNSVRIVLASGSPRRQELIQNLGIKVELCPSLFEENLKPEDFPTFSAFIEETALQKVLEVSNRLAANSQTMIIGADTMVTLGDKYYGKPHTPDKAFAMLSELNGRTNVVVTGVVIKFGDKITKFVETAEVKFGTATPEQIQGYVDTGEPIDKAGGYGIQGVGGTFVERINGDYFTVVGLPLYRLSTEICKLFHYPT